MFWGNTVVIQVSVSAEYPEDISAFIKLLICKTIEILKPTFLQGLTWQIRLLHLARSTSVLGLTSDIVWTEGKGLERTQIQQLGWSA